MNLEINQDQVHQDDTGERLGHQFLKFLCDFKKEGEVIPSYQKSARTMIQNQKNTLILDYHDFSGEFWAQLIIQDYCKYEKYLTQAIYKLVQLVRENEDIPQNTVYFLRIVNYPPNKKLRMLKTDSLGRMSSFEGTVTRSTEVRPELITGSFICKLCNTLKKGVQQQFKYTEPKFCEKPGCDNKNQWEIDLSTSSFTDFQKLRVQENSSDIPPGGMPRSIDVIVRDTTVDIAKPGDKCLFTGYLAVVPDIFALSKPGEQQTVSVKQQDGFRPQNTVTTDGITGLKQLGQRDLNYKLIFICNNVQTINDRFNQVYKDEEDDEECDEYINNTYDLTKPQDIQDYYNEKWNNMFLMDEIILVRNMLKDDNEIYKNLSKSIAPQVCGHDEIKKGILLQLLSGVHKKTHEQTNLRGDINICIVGDPSTAKSQFLKWVAQFLPRSVYTSGKASSAAGLTASVTRDPETGEYCIQTGALMLADHGICCIDEFDKMDQKDQSAIHEAMEQQTISITKAGIQATLNARASILAAANPISGRYDKNMSAPIMSRFDLFFVVLDEMSQYMDEKIAQYILDLHKDQQSAYKDVVRYSETQLKLYIRLARTIKPYFTKEAAEQLHKEYVKLRMNDLTSQKTSYRITVRQLESLIRLSEARAKLELKDQITKEYVIEASRLLSNSILKIEKPDQELEFDEGELQRPVTMIEENQNIAQQDVVQRQQNVVKEKFKITIEEYNSIGRQILSFVKHQEKLQEGESEDNGVRQQDIVTNYLQDNIDRIKSESEAQKLTNICKSVIKKLINEERVLIISQDNSNISERRLKIHSNYTDDL